MPNGAAALGREGGSSEADRWRVLIGRARAMPRWKLVVLLALVIPNLIYAAVMFAAVVLGGEAYDWWTFQQAAARVGGSLYDWQPPGETYNYTFRYSPLFAYLLVPITALGIAAWRLLHIAVLALLPWRLSAVVLLTWPFWEDVWHGNTMTFAFVFGFLALRGSRWAGAAFLVLTLLVPRPLMLPVIVWILWKRPTWRIQAAVITAVMVVMTLATGEAMAFLGAVLRSTDGLTYGVNLSPSRFIGIWWLALGVPLAAWLTWKGRVGLASLTVSPYVFPYHLMIGLLDLRLISSAHQTASGEVESPQTHAALPPATTTADT